MLYSAEHEIFSANIYENANNNWHFHIYWQRKFHSLLINMKMPTIVGTLIFISRENFMLSYILQEKIVVVSNLRFISRPKFLLS